MGGPGLWRLPCRAGLPPHTGAFARWLEERRGWRLRVARHPERQLWRYGLEQKPVHTFRVLPRRRVAERTFARRLPCIAGRPARLGHSRRLSKDYERLPAVAEPMIYGAMSRLMLRRLSHSAAREASETDSYA